MAFARAGLAVAVVALLPAAFAQSYYNQAPTVAITAPAAGATVHGVVQIQGTASDPDSYLTRVEIRIDSGAWQAAQGTYDWTYQWDTTQVPLGSHTLSARAYDGQDHSAVSSRAVTVVEPPNRRPAVVITSPAANALVGGLVAINGTATDPDGDPVTVEVRIVGVTGWEAASGGADWSYAWDTGQIERLSATIQARAHDGTDPSDVVERSVTVENRPSNHPPAVTILEPRENEEVSTDVLIRGTALDPDGDLITVHVRVPGQFDWRPVDGATNWSYTWRPGGVQPGPYSIEVRAVDDWGLNGTATVRFTLAAAGSAPTVRIVEPFGPTVSGRVRIAGSASDADGTDTIVAVHYRIENVTDWVEAVLHGDGGWSAEWDATNGTPGAYTLRVRATDLTGNTRQALRELVVESPAAPPPGPNAPPTVTLDEPRPGAVVRGTLRIIGGIADPDAGDSVVLVQVAVDDGPWRPAEIHGSTFVLDLNTTGVAEGPHRVTVRAFDGRDWSAPFSAAIVVDNAADEPPPEQDVPLPAALGLGALWVSARFRVRHRR